MNGRRVVGYAVFRLRTKRGLFINLSLLLTMLACFFVTLGASAIGDSVNADAALQIEVNSRHRYSGTLMIDLVDQPRTSVSLYILLPFRISDVVADSENVQLAYNVVADRLSILSIVLAPTAAEETEIRFQILPPIVESTQMSSGSLSYAPNFLLIENRGSARYTLYFRFNTKTSDKSFGQLTKFMDGMIMPSEIRITFPENTIFYTIPPTTQSSNIAAGNNPGRELPNELAFATSLEFYQDKYLWINYSIPSSMPTPSLIIHIMILGLSPLGGIVLAIPEEILSKKHRLRIATASALVVLVLFIVNLKMEGSLYLISNLTSLIPGAAVYLLTIGLLVLNGLPSLRAGLEDLRNRLRRQFP